MDTGMRRATIQFTTGKLANDRTRLSVGVADTPLARARGLSFARTLPGDGLLFIFGRPSRSPFWMWGMSFPIDLIWISGGRVVGWEENLRPEALWRSLFFPFLLKRYSPPVPVDAVLEVEAGFCRKRVWMQNEEVGVQVQQASLSLRGEGRGEGEMNLRKQNSGQAAVGYVLAIAAVSMGVAAVLYGPQIKQSLKLLYTDAATRVIESGPVSGADIRKEQEKVWGSASLPPAPSPNPMPPAAPPWAPPPSPSSPPPPDDTPKPWSGGPSTAGAPTSGSSPGGAPGSGTASPSGGGSSPPASGGGSSSSGSGGVGVPPGVGGTGGASGAPGANDPFSSGANMSCNLTDGTEGGMCQAEPSSGGFL